MTQEMAAGGGRRASAADEDAEVALREILPGGVGVKSQDSARRNRPCRRQRSRRAMELRGRRASKFQSETKRPNKSTVPGATSASPSAGDAHPLGCQREGSRRSTPPASVWMLVSGISFLVSAGVGHRGRDPPHPLPAAPVPPSLDLSTGAVFSPALHSATLRHSESLSLFASLPLPPHLLRIARLLLEVQLVQHRGEVVRLQLRQVCLPVHEDTIITNIYYIYINYIASSILYIYIYIIEQGLITCAIRVSWRDSPSRP
jgi:hypothetical protein